MNRKIDALGRIVIPKEIRKQLSIADDEELMISVVDNKIILEKENHFNIKNYIEETMQKDINPETYQILDELLSKI